MSLAGWIRLIIIAGSVLALEVACRTGAVPVLTMIPPSEMASSLWKLLISGRVNGDIVFSLTNVISTILLSVLGGFVIGAALHAVPRLRHALDPLLSAYYAVPIFVFYPLLIVMMGIGPPSLITMGAMFGVIAMIINTLIGLDRVPAAMMKTSAVMQLGPLRSLLFVRIPAASLHLVAGAKLAIAYSIIGIVAGEFILATAGVGKRIAFAYNDFDNQMMYGLLLLLLTFTITVNLALSHLENRLRKRWGQ